MTAQAMFIPPQHLIDRLSLEISNGREERSIQVFEALQKRKTPKEARDRWGRTALYQAVKWHNIKVMEHLLSREVPVETKNEDGQHILHAVGICVYEDIATLKKLHKQARGLINVPDNKGMTPLMSAVRAGNYKISRELILLGANVNQKDSEGNNVLNHLIKSLVFESEDKKSFPAYVRERDKNLNNLLLLIKQRGLNLNDKNIYKETALHLAARTDNVLVVKFLLQNRVSKCGRDYGGKTPYERARQKKSKNVLKILKK